jgi:hypothetical protein
MRSSNRLCLLVLVAACSTSTTTTTMTPDAAPPPPAGYSPSQAKWEFWSAYHAGQIDNIPAARDHLIAAMNSDPQDDELPRLVGMSLLLTTFEGSAMPNGNPMQATQQQGMYLDQARQLAQAPYAKALDTILYSGYPFLLGQQQMNAQETQQAIDLMTQVQAQYPILGQFATATILLRAPRTSPYYAQAVEDYFRYYELCTGTTIDRTTPDLSAMQHGTTADLLCQSFSNVPHVVQGGLFLFGDVLVKNNQIEAARAVYQVIPQTDGFGTWKYADLVNQRLSSDLAARAAQYDPANANPPPLGASPCLACHED